MGKYDELPVFKASYDLLVEIFSFTINFSKEYKYTVGERLNNETLILSCANETVEKPIN